MDFRPLDFPERYELFPDAVKLANLTLKKLGYLTSQEQHAAANHASQAGISSYLRGESPEKIKFHAEQRAQFSNINPIRDLAQLTAERVKVRQALDEVKKTYNELVKVCIERSPQFMDLVWQIYRRAHVSRAGHHILENIINPPEPSNEKGTFELREFPKTDEERVKNYKFDLNLTSDSQILKKEPFRRLVETDYGYFYGTGRFAFAGPNGDIFQTIWDERQKDFPLFKLY